MAWSRTEEERIKALEANLNDIETAVDKLATKRQVNAILALLQPRLDQLDSEVSQIHNATGATGLTSHKVDPDAHQEINGRFVLKSELINTSSGVDNAGLPIKTNTSGLLDPTFLPPIDPGAQNLVDLLDVSQTDTPVKNDVVIWNGTEFVFAPYNTSFTFSIASFSSNAGSSIQLIGTGTWKAIGALSFSASYNNGPASNGYVSASGWSNLTLDNTYQGPTVSVAAVTYPSVGSTRSFTLSATDGTNSGTSTLTYYFYNYRFWGVTSTASGYTEADIEGLTSELSNSIGKTVTLTPSAGQYIVYCYPTRLGTATFTVGGFEGGFQPPEIVSVTNSLGFTENYYVYRSTNSGLGATTVVVS